LAFSLLLFRMTKNSAESQVAERRLRPIYDWLDNGNNKKALQEADKVLKKQPDFQCCKVLKCLALIRLGKESEAEIILNKVLDEVPVDEGALQAMSIAWRELQQPEKICKMYEGAVKKEPSNEDFLSHLFMSYVRMGYYKKQQKVAMNLFKAAHKNPYYYWSVMSLVLQALEGEGDEKLGKTVHLPLALRMLQKMENEGKVEQEQEILLFCLILEMKEDWKAGIDLLNGPLGQRLAKSGSYRTFVHCKMVEWQKQCQGWTEVRRLSKEELNKMPDQWSAWCDFIAATINMHKENNNEDLIKEVEDYIKSNQSDHPEMRGPWMAEMEFRSQLGQESELPKLIVEYFNKFGSKLVSYADIVKYLDKLTNEQRQDVYKELSSMFRDKEIGNQADICRDVNIWQLKRYCGLMEDMSVDELLEEVDKLVCRYRSVQHLVCDMVTTDIRPSDEYLVLASHVLWDLWHVSKLDKYYLQCCVLLYWGLSTSPSNWQLRLMLIRMMTSAGCGGYAREVHSSLDIKHLMLDSLGWVLQHQLVQCGHLLQATQHHFVTMKLYTQVNKDTADHIITAYRTGTFYQIRDIYKLRKRITTSFNLMSNHTESNLFMLHKTSSHAATLSTYIALIEDEDWDTKRDNRDLDTMVSWDPASSRDPKMRETTLRTELLYTRTRQLILVSVIVCIKLSDDSSAALVNGDTKHDQISENIAKLESHWSLACQESASQPSSRPVPQSPPSPNLPGYKSSNQVDTILKVIKLVKELLTGDDVKIDVDDISNSLEKNLEDLSESINANSLNLYLRRELLETIMWHLETIGLCCVLFGVIGSILRGPGSSTKGKKIKRGKVLEKFSHCLEPVNNLVEKFLKANKKLEDTVNVFEANLSLATVSDRLNELNFGDSLKEEDFLKKETEELFAKMETSYKESFSQIKETLQLKQEYLESIKL